MVVEIHKELVGNKLKAKKIKGQIGVVGSQVSIQKIHHLKNKGLLFIFFHQNSLNFDWVQSTGPVFGSKFSEPGTGPGYNQVLNFTTSTGTGLTGSQSIPLGSKPVLIPEPGTRFFCSSLVEIKKTLRIVVGGAVRREFRLCIKLVNLRSILSC